MTMLPLAGREREIGVLHDLVDGVGGRAGGAWQASRQRDVGPAGGGEHLHLCARWGIQRWQGP
jgi:hypothetical protein